LTRRPAFVQTRVVPTDAVLGGDLEDALNHVSVPAYVLDSVGVVRWLNKAAAALIGDVRGRQFSSLVVPEESRHVREAFARKIAGTARVTDFDSIVTDVSGNRVGIQVSSVQLRSGDRVVGVFGQVTGFDEEPPPMVPLDVTPRQAEVLRLLEHGRSTDEIAAELHLSRETVRNHVRGLLRSLGVRSRLEAVALAHGDLVA
jgi:PAS domain S-box-containing protein